jgi:ABC-type uncharacterized transport system YnjBCD ATPase subunit
MATIDQEGKLALDKPLTIDKNSLIEVIVLIPETVDIDENEDKPEATIRDDFRQPRHEAMTGKTIPLVQVWNGKIENK